MGVAKSSVPGNIIGVIYGVRHESSPEYRYVGLTTTSIRRRTSQHFKNAELGVRNPFYDWLRKAPRDLVYVESLQVITSTLEQLGEAEIDWIGRLRAQGDRLMNLSGGGLGPTRIEWSAVQRDAARLRSTGRSVPPRFGADNPMFGQNHSDEQKALWSAMRKGRNSGRENPNFGRFGEEHPSFGHRMSAEAKAVLSEQRRGSLNPNFGRKASAESLAKRSAAQKGIPRPGNARNAHVRYHSNVNVEKADCKYCVEDAARNLNALPTGKKTHD